MMNVARGYDVQYRNDRIELRLHFQTNGCHPDRVWCCYRVREIFRSHDRIEAVKYAMNIGDQAQTRLLVRINPCRKNMGDFGGLRIFTNKNTRGVWKYFAHAIFARTCSI